MLHTQNKFYAHDTNCERQCCWLQSQDFLFFFCEAKHLTRPQPQNKSGVQPLQLTKYYILLNLMILPISIAREGFYRNHLLFAFSGREKSDLDDKRLVESGEFTILLFIGKTCDAVCCYFGTLFWTDCEWLCWKFSRKYGKIFHLSFPY